MRRVRQLFRNSDAEAQQQARRVQDVLSSCQLSAALGLSSQRRVAPSDASPSDAARRSAELDGLQQNDPEAAVETVVAEVSSADVLEAYLCAAVDTHPYKNECPEAAHAFRWLSEAFKHMGAGGSFYATDPEALPLRERICSTTTDEALRLFSDTIASTLDSLNLHDISERGLGKAASEALLKGLHILHVSPVRGSQHDVAFFDSVLYGTLAAHWFLALLIRLLGRSPTRRLYLQRYCSTTVVALGGVAFGGASRLGRMMRNDHPRPRRRSELGTIDDIVSNARDLAPHIRCPLCREVVNAGESIRNVRAGDAVPTCCICTEAQSSVCLPCGHLCLCEDCFSKLPRATDV